MTHGASLSASLCLNVQSLPPVLKVFSRRWSQRSLRPPPGRTTTEDIRITPRWILYGYKGLLTKNPAQKGQDCLTRAEEVNAILVKEKARTMAPKPIWHSPRYRSSRAPPAPRTDIPLRLSDQPRDPEAEAMLLESDSEGMACAGDEEGGFFKNLMPNLGWPIKV